MRRVPRRTYDGSAGAVPVSGGSPMHISTVDAVLEYDVKAPAHFCFNVEAAHWPTQTIVGEQLTVSPDIELHRFIDAATGNRCFRFDAPPGPLAVRYQAEVRVRSVEIDEDLAESPLGQLPDDVFPFLLPTRYCESDLLAGTAQDLFGREPPGIARVRRIVKWVHESIRYRPGSTDSTTTAQAVFVQRAGVCRDFAHLAVTFCRALNIPARLVVGYVWFDEPPQDFHAAFEAWLGGRWVLFDPTGLAPVDRLVRIGTGGDATDVAFSTFFGSVAMTRKAVTVLEHEPRTVPGSGHAVLELAVTGA
jgi:transglutaminase-like putative cysteine protease